jgi:folate-binding protein YgfZ
MANTMLIDRAIIRLSGEGVRDFLQGLITNDVSGALPVWAGLLTPQGKALFDFIVWGDGDDLLIDCEAAQVDAIARRLTLYRLRRAIVIARDDTLAVHWASSGEEGVPDPRNAALGQRWVAPPDGASEGYHAHRLSVGVVEGAAELGSDQTLWLEGNAIAQNGVSFTKGCYIGQENTARMFHRDKVRKRLAVAAADAEPEGARAWYPELKRAVVVERLA